MRSPDLVDLPDNTPIVQGNYIQALHEKNKTSNPCFLIFPDNLQKTVNIDAVHQRSEMIHCQMAVSSLRSRFLPIKESAKKVKVTDTYEFSVFL